VPALEARDSHQTLPQPSIWRTTRGMALKSPLDDPQTASFAWGRYRRLMRFMVVIALVSVIAGLSALRWMIGPIPIHMAIATAGGIFFSVALGAALMSLVFLSNGTGHDAAVENPFDEDGKER
jgi:hypothetical protein